MNGPQNLKVTTIGKSAHACFIQYAPKLSVGSPPIQLNCVSVAKASANFYTHGYKTKNHENL